MRKKTKPDALAGAIGERLRRAYSGDMRAHLHNGQYNRLTRRLNSLARVAGLGSANGVPYRERHKLALEACARGFGSHPAAEELLYELARLERWAEESARELTEREARGSDADVWRELGAEYEEFLKGLGEEEADGTRQACTPEGWRKGDKFCAVTPEDDAFEWAGLREGETAVIYETADVSPDDLAAVEIDGETWLGRYGRRAGGLAHFEEDGDGGELYRPGGLRLLGRVAHFERGGEVFKRFRPIREGGR
jgi:hypothetical protein